SLAGSGGELWLLVLVVVAGLGIAGYLTAVHYAKVPLACSVTSFVNCAQVTQSTFSVVPGTSVPITVPGMAWFGAMGAIAVAGLRLSALGLPEPTGLRPLHFLLAVAGLAAVLYLVYAELVVLHRICEWCTAVHVLVLASAVITLLRLQRWQPQE
ncbi:MAG: vitamin K epoxide reductase family protein, partial [Acidimicrobiales bacterium]